MNPDADEGEDTYYFNPKTKETTYTLPPNGVVTDRVPGGRQKSGESASASTQQKIKKGELESPVEDSNPKVPPTAEDDTQEVVIAQEENLSKKHIASPQPSDPVLDKKPSGDQMFLLYSGTSL